jgi:hypothetical protein
MKIIHDWISAGQILPVRSYLGSYQQTIRGAGIKSKKVYFGYSTIWVSAYLSSQASRNSGVMCREPFGQISLHWEQKMHWVT